MEYDLVQTAMPYLDKFTQLHVGIDRTGAQLLNTVDLYQGLIDHPQQELEVVALIQKLVSLRNQILGYDVLPLQAVQDRALQVIT